MERRAMKASKPTDAQKGFIIKQDEDGAPVAEICRKAGISQATYFNWKREVRRSDAVGDTAPAPGDWSPERLAAPNRLRRQVELAFKRMKSLVGLKDLRAKDPDFARLWINTARLAEDDLPALDPEAPDPLPWPPDPSRSPDLAPRRHGHHQHPCRRPAGARKSVVSGNSVSVSVAHGGRRNLKTKHTSTHFS